MRKMYWALQHNVERNFQWMNRQWSCCMESIKFFSIYPHNIKSSAGSILTRIIIHRKKRWHRSEVYAKAEKEISLFAINMPNNMDLSRINIYTSVSEYTRKANGESWMEILLTKACGAFFFYTIAPLQKREEKSEWERWKILCIDYWQTKRHNHNIWSFRLVPLRLLLIDSSYIFDRGTRSLENSKINSLPRPLSGTRKSLWASCSSLIIMTGESNEKCRLLHIQASFWRNPLVRFVL